MPEMLKDLRVLAVEDNIEAMRLLNTMLSDFGIAGIETAKDGQEALISFQRDANSIDVIICDWNMPEMSGIEFLRKVRDISPDIPFIMVTGASDMESVAEAKNHGVSAYIKKPYNVAELQKKLNVVLRVIKARQTASN